MNRIHKREPGVLVIAMPLLKIWIDNELNTPLPAKRGSVQDRDSFKDLQAKKVFVS